MRNYFHYPISLSKLLTEINNFMYAKFALYYTKRIFFKERWAVVFIFQKAPELAVRDWTS
jgi:hypothetical protein